MGDSAAMTVEFLRARLLSERSVSTTARQRADQLAKRVMELEEQLSIVTIQRKKAEKAAAEVLAILETQGIGDLSEAIDSSSDQDEIPCRKGSDDTLKEDESSAASRMERSDVEDGLSGSEPEVFPPQGKSLSWKSRNNSPDSRDKQRAKEIRQRQRRRSFMSTVQSCPKHHSGKSCRKIKPREMGSTAESEETCNPTLLDANGNGVSNYCDDQPKFSMEASRGKIEEAFADNSVSCCLDDQNKETEADPYANGSGRDEEMERALEQQAQLIGQFQAEENAQREWEEKYNENKMSTLPQAYYEPGNQSCIADHSSQPKDESTEIAEGTPHSDEEAKAMSGNISSTKEAMAESLSSSEKSNRIKEAYAVTFSNGFMSGDLTTRPSGSSSDARGNVLVGQPYDGLVVNEIETKSQEFAFPAPECSGVITNGKQNQGLLHDNSNTSSHSNSSLQQHGHRIIERPSNVSCFPINSGSKLLKSGPSEIQSQLQRQLPRAPSSSLGGVLEALQRAKLSLRQELTRLPSQSQGTLGIAAPANFETRAITSAGNLDIPIGSAGLFRLPTESFPQAHFSGPKFYGSGLSLTAGRPDVGYATSPYGYQNSTTTTYGEAGSRVLAGKEYFDHYLSSSMGVPDSSRYALTYSDLSAESAPLRNEFSKSFSDVRNGGVPDSSRYSLTYSDLSAERAPIRNEFSKSYPDVRNGGVPDSSRYSLTYSDPSAAERAPFGREISKSYSDVRNRMPPGDRYALYGAKRTPSDMQML